jgi:hypothetical protein
MTNILDRQTFVFSVNLNNAGANVIQTPISLRFAADELILKSISYNNVGNNDTTDVVQIWCNITNDNLIGSFPNNDTVFQTLNSHFRISNTFQTGIFELQFQQTANNVGPIYYNPQPLIGASTKGVVVITIEFTKLAK